MATGVPQVDGSYANHYSGERYTLRAWLYDVAVFIFDVVFTIFFREIRVRGSYHVPPKGTAAILVCAPHANQFIDPCLVMSQTRKISGSRSRQTCFVTAENSIKKNRYVRLFGSWTGAVPVARVQDNLAPVNPSLNIYVPDYDADPTLVKLVRAEGASDDVEISASKLFTPKSMLGLPGYIGSAVIQEIIDENTVRLQKPFGDSERVRKCVSSPTAFLYAHKIDNSVVFQKVFNSLHTKGCVGIFPEGGSHDRPSLLPIKAGVAIMALGAAAAEPSLKIHVVPCGLHYFHRQKFRSRATLEYAEPIIVDGAMGAEYLKDPKGAVSSLLKKIEEALYSVTINADDYDTLMAIQTARRLYQTSVKRNSGDGENDNKFPLSTVVELNRRMLLGYSKTKGNPRIQALMTAIRNYNSKLFSIGLKDHQVDQLHPREEKFIVAFTLFLRSFQLYFMALLSLPGVILFSPIFITCHHFSKKKALEGLKKSMVKIKGDDIIATWKIVVALSMAPTLYTVYSLVMVFLTRRYPSLYEWLIVPHFVFNSKVLYFVYCYAVLILATYMSFVTGEIGMDIIKSIKPLVVSLIYPSRTYRKLRETRLELSQQVLEVCNELGPEVFADFQMKYVKDQAAKTDEANAQTYENSMTRSSSSHSLSKVNSRGSLAEIPIFSDGLVSASDLGNDSEDSTDVELLATNSKISSLIMERRKKEYKE